MVLVKVGIEICRLFCLAVFACSLRRIFTLNHRNLLKSADCLSKLAVGTLGENSGKELYTNQIKFDFGANFAIFKIAV